MEGSSKPNSKYRHIFNVQNSSLFIPGIEMEEKLFTPPHTHKSFYIYNLEGVESSGKAGKSNRPKRRIFYRNMSFCTGEDIDFGEGPKDFHVAEFIEWGFDKPLYRVGNFTVYFEVLSSGVFSTPMDESILGKEWALRDLIPDGAVFYSLKATDLKNENEDFIVAMGFQEGTEKSFADILRGWGREMQANQGFFSMMYPGKLAVFLFYVVVQFTIWCLRAWDNGVAIRDCLLDSIRINGSGARITNWSNWGISEKWKHLGPFGAPLRGCMVKAFSDLLYNFEIHAFVDFGDLKDHLRRTNTELKGLFIELMDFVWEHKSLDTEIFNGV